MRSLKWKLSYFLPNNIVYEKIPYQSKVDVEITAAATTKPLDINRIVEEFDNIKEALERKAQLIKDRDANMLRLTRVRND